MIEQFVLGGCAGGGGGFWQCKVSAGRGADFLVIEHVSVGWNVHSLGVFAKLHASEHNVTGHHRGGGSAGPCWAVFVCAVRVVTSTPLSVGSASRGLFTLFVGEQP